MDYGSLLQLAKKTSDLKKEAKRSCPNVPSVRTSAEQKNAELEKKKLLDANVARFLAKREAEERKRKHEASIKRDGLLAIRNKDSKARKRVKIMNKSAKSADKSAIEDAVGPSEYYVIEEPLCFMSQESLAQEEKFLEKLCKVPEDEKFSKKKANLNKDLSGTKDRVKLALQQGDITEKKERTRESKDKNKDKDKAKDDKFKIEREEPKVEEKKPKKSSQPRPPPMNYHELLKLAEKLQQEPVQEAIKEKEPETRPMTTKERELYLLEEASRKRKEEGWKVDQRPKKVSKISSSSQFHSQGSKTSLSIGKEEKSISSIPRIPKVKDSSIDKKSIFGDERRQKSSREENYGSSAQRSSHRFDEKSSTSKQSSRQNESKNSSKQNSVRDRNTVEQAPKEDITKYIKEEKKWTSEKPQGLRRDKEQSSSSRLPFQQGGKNTQMSREKEGRPESSKDLRPNHLPPAALKSTMSTADGKQNPKKLLPCDKSRNINSSEMKPKLENSDLSNSKQRGLQPSSTKPKQFSTPDSKSRPIQSDPKTKQSPSSNIKPRPIPSDPKPKQLPPPDIKSRPIHLDSKSKQYSSDVKSRSIPPDSRSKQNPVDIKSRHLPSSDFKFKQHTADNKSKQVQSSNSKPTSGQNPSDVRAKQLPSDHKNKQFPPSDVRSKNSSPSNVRQKPFPPPDVRPKQFPPADVRPRQFPPADVRPKQFPPADVRSKQFPPADVRPKQFPPADVRPKQFPPGDVRRGPKPQAKKRRVIDSDDEYDSEVADFIDDGPDDGEDYSKHIREIFGYDRSRYRGMDDDDDECMESSFSQQMKEEFKSTKLGIMEDLEDIRREKQREAMLKKKRRLK